MYQLSESIKQKWQVKGFASATPIQTATQALIADGEDLVAISPTGSGKTLAYLLPLLNKIEMNHQLQVLIVVPSQELAQQIGEVIREWKPNEMTAQVLAGGANVKRQIENLKKKPEIIVGTPGRLLELSTQRKLKLHQIQTLVLDEADYLLQLEHLQQTRELIKKCPSQRQLLFFSATRNEQLDHVSQWINTSPRVIDKSSEGQLTNNVKHAYIESPVRKKDELLRKFANMQQFQSLVFVNSLANAAILAEKLAFHRIPCALLTSDAHQAERKAAIQAFKKGEVLLLLTTDVAARGLDIEDLPVVIHYDLPDSQEVYIHRSGRTGRMGKEGLVLSFVTEKEIRDLKRFVPDKTQLRAYQVHAGELKIADKKPKKTDPKRSKPKAYALDKKKSSSAKKSTKKSSNQPRNKKKANKKS